MGIRTFFLALLIVAALCTVPAFGLTTYSGSSPRMTAVISGVNEFVAGQDTTITVIVQNSGLSTMQNSWAGYSQVAAQPTSPDLSRPYQPDQGNGNIQRDDLPTTAKMVTVGLGAGNAPLIVKSDPQTVGDIPTQGMVAVPIQAKILANASIGEYQVPLTITYTYLQSSTEAAADVLQSNYVQNTVTVPLTIRIKPQVKIAVLSAVPETLNVGTEGYIDLQIQNTGSDDGKKATVQILRNGASPIIPVDSSVFIGDFPRGGIVSARYKVAISGDAGEQSYPVDVAVTYENSYGDVVTSASETAGIPVSGKITFNVTSDPAQVTPGSNGVVTVVYRNNGDATAYAAQVRITSVDPFTSSDDTSYLGDLKPGDSATARFQLSADGTAAAKEYLLDTQVRYRDALDDSQLSDTFKVPVTVVPKPPAGGPVQALSLIAIVVLAGAGAGYYLLVMRKKK